jgi:hypothetical protein
MSLSTLLIRQVRNPNNVAILLSLLPGGAFQIQEQYFSSAFGGQKSHQ